MPTPHLLTKIHPSCSFAFLPFVNEQNYTLIYYPCTYYFLMKVEYRKNIHRRNRNGTRDSFLGFIK